ncbi:phytoene desaturase [Salinarimonas ramus]|uniref:phytoene desaturase n=1 Tax=Salinarimonas ramus TaxID=690164 RepID=UPI003570BE1B
MTHPPRAGLPALEDRPHAVIVGSGFGGLAAAVRLGARGYRVTVLEKLDQPGGRARVFREGGFTFDAGPTLITAPHLFEELWEICGRRMEDDVAVRPLDPFYTIRFDDGETFRYSGDTDAMRAEIARLAPDDLAGYETFMAASEEICRVGFEELGHVPFASISDMLRVAPDLVRLGAQRSVYGLVAKHFRDERLRTVFSFHPLLIGGNPFSASAIYALIHHLEKRWGVHYAQGGINRLVAGIVGLIEGQGGRVRLGAPVQEILLEGRRAMGVRLESGETIRADIVVSNADSSVTYGKLLPQGTRTRWGPARQRVAQWSMGLFVWYFGTKRRYEDVGHHTIALGPRYRALLDDIFRKKHLADDFSLYLHRPSASDPSVAPDGCDAFYVLSPVPNLLGRTNWEAEAEAYRRKIEQRLAETLLPGLSDEIVVSRVLTPQDFERDYASLHGAGFGLEPVMWQSAWFRPHNKSESIENLYLVGAGTHPGAGMPGVLSTARVLDRVVPDPDQLVRSHVGA